MRAQCEHFVIWVEQYQYVVEHIKGKEIKAAVCLSRLFSVTEEENSIRETSESLEGDTGNSEMSSFYSFPAKEHWAD